MNRKLYLFAVLAAVLCVGAAGCKKKPKQETASSKADMKAAGATMDAMQKPSERPVAKRTAPGMDKPKVDKPKTDKPKTVGSVTITKKALKAGAKRVSLQKGKMHFVMKAGDKQVKIANQSLEEKHEEVLAVKGSAITKLRVTFKIATEIDKSKAAEKKKVSPLEGKTFVLEAKGGKVVVTDDKGKATPEKLADKVRKKYKSFGKPDLIFESLPTTPIKVGQKVDALVKGLQADFAQEFAGSKAKWSLAGVEITLKEVRGVKGVKLAVFSMKMKMSIAEGKGFTMTMHLQGEYMIRAQDGQLGGASLKGPLDVMGQKNAGTVHRTETITYP